MRTLATWRRILALVGVVTVALVGSGPALGSSRLHRRATATAQTKSGHKLVKKKPAHKRGRERAVPVYTRSGLPNILAQAAVLRR